MCTLLISSNLAFNRINRSSSERPSRFNKISCVQSRLKFNGRPDKEWKEVIEDLQLTINKLVKERLYVNPEIKIKNLRTQKIKIVDKNDTQVNNDYIINNEWELEPLRNEEMEPMDDLPF